jgi:hypothetical protein
VRFILALFGTAATLSGCVGVGTMRTLAPDEGVEVRYAVPADSVLDALPGALADRHLRIEVREPADSVTTVVIAKKGANLFSYGELVRVRVTRTALADVTSARLVARSGYALDHSGRVDRVAPRVIQTLDASLSAAALGPFPGMQVRGRTGTDGEPLRGRVIVGSDSALWLAPDPSAPSAAVRLAALRDVAVFRGSYSHRSEGATVGYLVGAVAGMAIGAAQSDGWGNGTWTGCLIGGAVGLLAGMGIGAAIRTEVWSEVGTVGR